jgi:hypothetical protein
MKRLQLFFIITAISFMSRAQDIAMHTVQSSNSYITKSISNRPIIPLLTDASFNRKYRGENVLVVFSGNEHIEYFNNKKYFIKSSVEWLSNDECYITIREFNLPNVPFKIGTKLHLKINKIKRGSIHYQSTLGSKSWTGKMKKIK